MRREYIYDIYAPLQCLLTLHHGPDNLTDPQELNIICMFHQNPVMVFPNRFKIKVQRKIYSDVVINVVAVGI